MHQPRSGPEAAATAVSSAHSASQHQIHTRTHPGTVPLAATYTTGGSSSSSASTETAGDGLRRGTAGRAVLFLVMVMRVLFRVLRIRMRGLAPW